MGCMTLEKIISGCPVLEKLHLQSWKGGLELKISKETLTELHIYQCQIVKLIINAPKLQYFAYEG